MEEERKKDDTFASRSFKCNFLSNHKFNADDLQLYDFVAFDFGSASQEKKKGWHLESLVLRTHVLYT